MGRLDPPNTYCWVSPPDTSYSNDPLEQELEGIRQGGLYPYLEDVKVYHCPADKGMKLIGGGYRSFSITGPMNGEKWGDTSFYAEKITDIVLPATKFVFIENTDDRGYNMGSWIMYVDPPGWIDPLAVWHRVRSTFGFADGHAEAQRWVDKSTFDMIVLDRNPPCTFNQTVYSTDSRQDVEWAAKHYVAKYLP